MTRILGRITSINVRKVLWTAEELGISYVREDWGLPIRDPHDPAFLALNPNALVPVLVEDDGFVLWESHAVMRFLAEGAEKLIPGDVRGSARMQQWLDWQQTELVAAWAYAYRALGRRMAGFDDQAQIDRSIASWVKRMSILEAHLAGRDYVAGDGFSLADITLGVAVHRWFGTPFEKSRLQAVEAYYERLKGRPASAVALSPQTP